jgi:cation diffusion facilitator family transporter
VHKSGQILSTPERDRQVRRVLYLEGASDLAVLLAKIVVGLSTSSLTILGDAVHSLTDLSNNVVALVIMRLACAPPDREHPYGHRKFETLAVFVLATLLTVFAFELALRAVERGERTVVRHSWGLAVMLGVLAVNIGMALWEGYRARQLDSDILRADARHTLSDVLVTILVILGWQLAALGYLWLDTAFALGVAAIILWLAYGLFKRAVPVLVDRIAAEPELLAEAVHAVPGVRTVNRIRSRWVGSVPAVDVVVTVAAGLSTIEAHTIADAVETVLHRRFAIEDITVHVEPDA